jgi:hypothetical protein
MFHNQQALSLGILSDVFHGFPLSFQANASAELQIMP